MEDIPMSKIHRKLRGKGTNSEKENRKSSFGRYNNNRKKRWHNKNCPISAKAKGNWFGSSNPKCICKIQ